MIVHLVTDRRRLTPMDGDAGTALLRQVREAVEAGVDVVQVRESDLDARALTAVVAAVVALARGTRTRVLVNERVDVALAAGADGVHLKADSMPVQAVRRIVPPAFVIGRSVHDRAEAERAADADYLIAGTVWATPSKPPGQPLLGLAGFAAIARAVRCPVLAIGGVTVERAAAVSQSGGAGVAAIGLFIPQPDGQGPGAHTLSQTVGSLRAQFDTSRSHS